MGPAPARRVCRPRTPCPGEGLPPPSEYSVRLPGKPDLCACRAPARCAFRYARGLGRSNRGRRRGGRSDNAVCRDGSMRYATTFVSVTITVSRPAFGNRFKYVFLANGIRVDSRTQVANALEAFFRRDLPRPQNRFKAMNQLAVDGAAMHPGSKPQAVEQIVGDVLEGDGGWESCRDALRVFVASHQPYRSRPSRIISTISAPVTPRSTPSTLRHRVARPRTTPAARRTTGRPCDES